MLSCMNLLLPLLVDELGVEGVREIIEKRWGDLKLSPGTKSAWKSRVRRIVAWATHGVTEYMESVQDRVVSNG
jgi:hypothetical protein